MIFSLSRSKLFVERNKKDNSVKNTFDSDIWIIWKLVQKRDINLWVPYKEFMDSAVAMKEYIKLGGSEPKPLTTT
jgi:hypothetical protein